MLDVPTIVLRGQSLDSRRYLRPEEPIGGDLDDGRQ